jgi:hypothetical protein
MKKKLSEVFLDYSLNDAEQELVAHFVRMIRGAKTAGGNRRPVSYRDMLELLWSEAYLNMSAYERTNSPALLDRADVIDAAANVVLAMAHDVDGARRRRDDYVRRVKAAGS